MQLIFSALAGSVTGAENFIQLKSGDLKTNLVELYSSEGCSSCPPAEEWLRSLRSEKGLWKNFVPLEFHVTYWDDLGWKDPFARPEYTQRQKGYAASWKAGSLYTPEVVLNGLEWRGWRSDDESLEKLGPSAGILEIKETAKGIFTAKFSPGKTFRGQPLTLNGALLARDVSSQVSNGENSGRQLKHDFLVNVYKKSLLQKSKNQENQLEGSLKFSGDELKGPPISQAVAFWVSGQDLTPVQAVGGDLNKGR